jgi:glycosyltransferase involved in cell wall biosynthesis
MKKILFLNIYDDHTVGGGAEMTLHHLMQGLLRRGIGVVMLSTSATPGLRQIERNGVRIWRAGLRNIYWPDMKAQHNCMAKLLWHMIDIYNIAMQPVLRNVLEIEKPDVVSMHNLAGWSSASWATISKLSIPSVQVLHDCYAICPKSTMFKGESNCRQQCLCCHLLRFPHRRLSSRVSSVVGVSHFILNCHLEQGYFLDVPNRRVIHNARNVKDLGVTIGDQVPAYDRPMRFGYIGRLEKAKGVEVLLDTFCAENNLDAELWIAGTGKEKYESALKKRYNMKKIRFLGRVKQREFFPQVDVVITPSLLNEALGMVVAEAFAFGKPVIGARRGGIPEMIRDGENGLLFDPEVPGELAECLRRIHCDTALRARLTANAKPSSAPFMDVHGWVGKYEALYREVISNNSTLEEKR